jgi:hypothetical protein
MMTAIGTTAAARAAGPFRRNSGPGVSRAEKVTPR